MPEHKRGIIAAPDTQTKTSGKELSCCSRKVNMLTDNGASALSSQVLLG